MNDHEYHPCILFTCDPEKNPNCSKTGCYLYGGRCSSTTNPEHAKRDENGYFVDMVNYVRDYDNAIIRAKPIEGFGKESFDIRVIKVEKGGIQ